MHRQSLEQRIGYAFSDASLLETALTHASVAGDTHAARCDNERMEYLGDAVLELCVSEYLYAACPDMREGAMTRMRAATVCGDSLHRVAVMLDLGPELHLAHGEEAMGGRHKPSILADCVEAVLGAVYLDGGLEPARAFVRAHVLPLMPAADEMPETKDYKTQLQECLPAADRAALCYRLTGEEGPDHHKTFSMQVMLADRVLGSGTGLSKQSAGQQAACDALQKLGMGDRACD